MEEEVKKRIKMGINTLKVKEKEVSDRLLLLKDNLKKISLLD